MPDRDHHAYRRPPGPGADLSRIFSLDGGQVPGSDGQAPSFRPKGDPILCGEAFEAAFAAGDAGGVAEDILGLNASLLKIYGRDDLLRLDELADRHARLLASRSFRIDRFPRPDPDPQAYEAAGTFAGQCHLLRLLAVEARPPERARFRLVDRAMSFAARGRGVVRIRGLTPTEQARRLRDERAQVRRAETLDRKARDAATPAIGGHLNALVRHDRDFAVPPAWHRDGYLPAELVGRRVAEAAAFIVEYHQVAGFDRARLSRWQDCLAGCTARAIERSRARSTEAPSIAPADEAALLGLVRGDQR